MSLIREHFDCLVVNIRLQLKGREEHVEIQKYE